MDHKNQTLIAVTKADTLWLILFLFFGFTIWQIVDIKKDIERLEDESIEHNQFIKDHKGD